MAGRPAKTHLQLCEPGSGHRTKAEIKTRAEAEKALLTGEKIKCKFNKKLHPTAGKEFNRLTKLMTAIEKNDAVYENIVNRYCLLYEECENHEKDIVLLDEMIKEAQESFESGELEYKDVLEAKLTLIRNKTSTENLLLKKRNMLLSIEKENAMTVAAALRAIPKKPLEKEKSETDYLF